MGELREVDRVVLERNDGRVAPLGRTLIAALVEHEIVQAVLLDRASTFGDITGDVGGIATILHEDATQRAVRASLAVVKNEAGLQFVERPRPRKIRDEV